MGKWIRDGLIGIVVVMTILVVWAGISGYVYGFSLNGHDATYGGDGATTMILLAVLFFGPYVAAFGLLAGLVGGWGVRWWKARRRG